MWVAREGQGPAIASLPTGDGDEDVEGDAAVDTEADAPDGTEDCGGVGLFEGSRAPLHPASSMATPALAIATEARIVPPHAVAIESTSRQP